MSDLVLILFGRLFTVACLVGVVYIGMAIFWQSLTGLAAFKVECVDHGEFDEDDDGCPDCEYDDVDYTEDPNGTDHAYDMLVDEQMGVHP